MSPLPLTSSLMSWGTVVARHRLVEQVALPPWHRGLGNPCRPQAQGSWITIQSQPARWRGRSRSPASSRRCCCHLPPRPCPRPRRLCCQPRLGLELLPHQLSQHVCVAYFADGLELRNGGLWLFVRGQSVAAPISLIYTPFTEMCLPRGCDNGTMYPYMRTYTL